MTRQVLAKGHRCEFHEKHSRFIAVALPCPCLDTFKQQLSQLTDEFADARHIAYAYVIQGDEQILMRFHDAGEPSGTAGRPILTHLNARGLIQTSLFVIRYFGGIKLGTGGLMRAYATAARQVLDTALLQPYRPLCRLSLTLPYADLKQLEYLLSRYQGLLIESCYGAHLDFTVEIALVDRVRFVEELRSTQIRCVY